MGKFKPNVEIHTSEKIILKYVNLLTTDTHLNNMTKMVKEINAVFMPANIRFNLKPINKEGILIFKNYYLRTTYQVAIAS